MRRVAIVNAGGHGEHSAEKGSYDSFVEMMERVLKEKCDSSDLPAAEVRVVQSTEDALKWVWNRGTIIYVTKGMAHEAKRVAKEHPVGVRVVVFTGSLPEREVIWVSKVVWVHHSAFISDVVLDG